MKTIIILQGIPGSGKTAWAKRWIKEDPKNRIRINNDDLQNMLGFFPNMKKTSLITMSHNRILEEAMFQGYDIVLDNMNLEETVLNDILERISLFNRSIAETAPDNRYKVKYEKFFNAALETCIKLDALKEHPLGEETIINLYNKYIKKTNKFYFYIDRKCTTWERSFYTIEASTEGEALTKCINNKVQPTHTELLYSLSDPVDNKSIEIYDSNTDRCLLSVPSED